MSEKDTLIVLAASYDSVSDAEVDYEAVKSLYNNAGVGHDFDAAVLERGDDGKVKVAHKHEESTRHGAWKGLAIGALAATRYWWLRNEPPKAPMKKLSHKVYCRAICHKRRFTGASP